MTTKQKPKESLQIVGMKVPVSLVRSLDKAAKKSGRTRSSEARLRLERSLKDQPMLVPL
jgi:hypothetical protein